MISVLMVTKYYPPFSSGGTEKYIEVFSKKLAEKGIAVTIAAPSTANATITEQNGQVIIHRFPIHKIKYLEYSNQMRQFIKNSHCDVIHFHTFDILCRYLRIGLETPYAITTHGFQLSNHHVFNPVVQLYRNQILKNNFQNAKRIFCVSLKDYENVTRLFGCKSETLSYLPNGVDIQKFSNLNKESIKKKNGLEERIVVTQVARFSPQKGQHVFLEAIKRLPKEIRDRCSFILTGYLFDNTYLSKLKQNVKENSLEKNVFFITNTNDDRLISIYGMSDIFVLPSFVEGLPLTLFEAWASKNAVIVTMRRRSAIRC